MNDPDADGEPVVVRWMNCRFWPATLEQMMSDQDNAMTADEFYALMAAAETPVQQWVLAMEAKRTKVVPVRIAYSAINLHITRTHLSVRLPGGWMHLDEPRTAEELFAENESLKGWFSGNGASCYTPLSMEECQRQAGDMQIAPTSATPAQAPDAEPGKPRPPSPAP